MLLPARDPRALLIKWVVGLLVPVIVFTFVWTGEQILNNVLLGLTGAGSTPYDTPTLIQAAIFIVVFYASMMALAGYLAAADSGDRGMIELLIDLAIFTLVPMLLALSLGLVIGLALCAVIWPLYFIVRRRVRKALHYTPPTPLKALKVLDAEQRAVLLGRAAARGFLFGAMLGLVWLIVDLIYYISGALPT